jgi:hypothetical protein
VVQGHVIRVERGDDWYAETGWTDTPGKLTVTLEGNGTEVDKTWGEIQSIDIRYGARAEVDCLYESQFTPWMYTCTLPTTSTVKARDGSTWTAGSRHKWRFVFDDGTSTEFYVNKLPQREQDTEEVQLDDPDPENHELYAKIQGEVIAASQVAPTRIVISP